METDPPVDFDQRMAACAQLVRQQLAGGLWPPGDEGPLATRLMQAVRQALYRDHGLWDAEAHLVERIVDRALAEARGPAP